MTSAKTHLGPRHTEIYDGHFTRRFHQVPTDAPPVRLQGDRRRQAPQRSRIESLHCRRVVDRRREDRRHERRHSLFERGRDWSCNAEAISSPKECTRSTTCSSNGRRSSDTSWNNGWKTASCCSGNGSTLGTRSSTGNLRTTSSSSTFTTKKSRRSSILSGGSATSGISR